MSADSFFASVLHRLTTTGESARRLRTLVFDPANPDEVRLFHRGESRQLPYPPLTKIFSLIKRTCRRERIHPERLKRIWFFSDRINLEFENTAGRTAVRTFWVANSALVVSRFTPLVQMAKRRGRVHKTRTKRPPSVFDGWKTEARRSSDLVARTRRWVIGVVIALHAACAKNSFILELAPAA